MRRGRRCHDAGVPIRVLGGGSKLLVRDDGVDRHGRAAFRAAIFSEIQRASGTVTAGGGAQAGPRRLDRRPRRGWPDWKRSSAFRARSAARCMAMPAAAAATSANGLAAPR